MLFQKSGTSSFLPQYAIGQGQLTFYPLWHNRHKATAGPWCLSFASHHSWRLVVLSGTIGSWNGKRCRSCDRLDRQWCILAANYIPPGFRECDDTRNYNQVCTSVASFNDVTCSAQGRCFIRNPIAFLFNPHRSCLVCTGTWPTAVFTSPVAAITSITSVTSIIRSAAVLVLPSQSLQPLLLGMCIDVCADDEPYGVEERYPNFVGKEGLRKGQSKWGGHP